MGYKSVMYGLCLYHQSSLTLQTDVPIFKAHKLLRKFIYLFLVKAKPLSNSERDSMEGAKVTGLAVCLWANDSIPLSLSFLSELEGKITYILPSNVYSKGQK